MDKIDAVFHHVNHLTHAIHRRIHTVVSHNGGKETSYLIIIFPQHILVVKPNGFLVVELRTRLRTFGDVKRLHQLVKREDFLLRSGIPAEQCEEVDHSLWEITAFAKALTDLSGLRICPLQGEYWEAQTVTIALRQLAFTLGFEQ